MSSERHQLYVRAPKRYPWRFNSPRESIHHIDTRIFIPFNKVYHKLEGITFLNPFPLKPCNIVHAFNRIPIGVENFIIGFESHLPRAFGWEATTYFRTLSSVLASRRCKKIVAISNYAADIFRATHSQSSYYESLAEKLIVRYPNMRLPNAGDPLAGMTTEPLVITFVGSHFGRKGGCVCVRMADLARSRGFPLVVHIVSKIEVGGPIWTDPPDIKHFEPYLSLLKLPNVHYYPGLPNHEVLTLLRRSHFSVLTTFSDTFGYSAIESMANYAPVIATRQGALPEFIRDGDNGILIHLPTNHLGEWSHQIYGPRNGERYRANYFAEIERMAEETLARLEEIAERPDKLYAMRENARQEAVSKFDHKSASQFWDRLYLEAAGAAGGTL